MVLPSILTVLCLSAPAVTLAQSAADDRHSATNDGPIARSVRGEVLRLAVAGGAHHGLAQPQPSGRRPNWVQRHPVRTAAIVGAVSGFLIGYLPGDDAVFYDFTAEFNGAVMGGIGAGAGASLVAIIQAVRR